MMFRKIFRKIKDYLKGIKGKSYWVKTESIEEWRKVIPKAVSRELARLEGKVEKLEKERENLLKVIESLKGDMEKKLVLKALEEEKKIKKERKEKRVKILFNFPKPVTIISVIGNEMFKGGNGKVYKYWRGLELSYEKDGTYVSFLLSENPKTDKLGKLGTIPIESFINVFENPNTLVNDIKVGIVKVNIDPNGKLIPKKLPCYEIAGYEIAEEPVKKKGKKGKNDEKIKKTVMRIKEIDVNELIRTRDPETVGVLLAAWDYAFEQVNKRHEALLNEKKALMDKIEAELALKAMERAVDRSNALLEHALNKLDVLSKRLGETKVLETDARLKQTIAEGVVKSQWEAIRNINEEIKKVGMSDEEKVRRNVERDFTFAMNKVMEALGIARGLTPVVKKEEKRG